MDKPSFYWGIASYHRVDRQPMLQNLVKMGYAPHEIILSTQTREDYDQYREKWGERATVIYREGHNVSENKNTILDYLRVNCGNVRVVMCSDKVRAVNRMTRNKKLTPIESREEMDELVKAAFFAAKRIGASIWGVAPVANTFYMDCSMSTNLFLLGCFMGILDATKTHFDPEQPLKEDWEIGLRAVAEGGRTLRLNDVCLTATFHTTGGAHDAWHTEGNRLNRECTERLLALYPELVRPHATRQNELRYVGKTDKIKTSIFDL